MLKQEVEGSEVAPLHAVFHGLDDHGVSQRNPLGLATDVERCLLIEDADDQGTRCFSSLSVALTDCQIAPA